MKVIVKNARLSFNDLFTAKCIGDSKTPKFSATLICLDGDEEGNPEGLKTTIVYTDGKGEKKTAGYDKMQAICEHAMKEKFGKVPAKHVNWAFNKADGSTTRDEHTNKDGDYYAGFGEDTFYISATKQESLCVDGKMTVIDQGKQPITAQSGRIFSGCFVNVVIDVYAFPAKNGSKEGVSASLEGIQLKAKGEPLGITKIDAADEFDEEEIPVGEDDTGTEADDLL